MRQTNDFEDQSGGLPLIYMALAVSFFVMLILVLVVAMNRDNNNKGKGKKQAAVSTQEEMQEEQEAPGLVASDLDFWDMYPEEILTSTPEEETTTEEETTEEDLSQDGKRFEITLSDGTKEWVDINQQWKRNTYDYTNLIRKNNQLQYYSGGKKVSFLGIELSKYQKRVNFAAMQAEGVDYCMIRVGARGYAEGKIQDDEMFETHIAGANAVNMPVGLYFYSQAITEAEAIAEADYVLAKIGQNKITYPIGFYMEPVENDTARIDSLTKEQRTLIAKAFLRRIELAGYTGILYGNEEWLVKKLDLSQLTDYDIWLAEKEDIPDYPYLFSMWQYTRQGEMYGVDGLVNLNISFVDYSAR